MNQLLNKRVTNRALAPLFVVASLAIAGCDGGSDGSDGSDNNTIPPPAPPAQNGSPVAMVNGPSTAAERTSFELDGSGSSDPDADNISYAWSLGGTPGVDVQLGDTTSISLTATVGEAVADETLEFRLTVNDSQGNSAETTFSVLIEEIDRDQLPPDPGPAGDTDLVGIDADSNGVRDDVEIAIYERHPANADARDMLMPLAEALQSAFAATATMNDAELIASGNRIAFASACLATQFQSPSVELAFVEAAHANTQERIAVYEAFNASQSGRFFSVPNLSEECP